MQKTSTRVIRLEVQGLKGGEVQVSPETLEFAKPNDIASFIVTFSTEDQPLSPDQFSEGQLTVIEWKHYVTSPVVVKSV